MSRNLESTMPARNSLGESLFLIQIGVGLALAVALFLMFRPKSRDSNFKDHGSGPAPRGEKPRARTPDLLAESRMPREKTKQGPLQLEGFRLDRAAHEILGISPLAPPREIQSAYREAMKRYHPDRVSAPGTPQWHEAQAIAQAISKARDELLEKAKRRGE